MNTQTLPFIPAVLAAAVLLAGCGKREETSPPPPKAPSAVGQTVKDAVDGFTGKTAVDAGRKAQDQIRKISAEHNQELDETMKKSSPEPSR